MSAQPPTALDDDRRWRAAWPWVLSGISVHAVIRRLTASDDEWTYRLVDDLSLASAPQFPGASVGNDRRSNAEGVMRKIIESTWGALQIGVHLVTGPTLHHWRTRWGATDEETRRRMPGDELVPNPEWSYTHAITINATRSAIWPWLLQLGQQRGGFYSYQGLENLVGCDIHNVYEIRPDLQQLRVGEVIRLHRSGFGSIVTIIEPERALVLGGPPDANGSRATWGFYLEESPNGTTRLLERGRHQAGRGALAALGLGPYLLDPIGFVMSKKMLRTIKKLAEAQETASQGPAERAA